jgi:hypothetical protein
LLICHVSHENLVFFNRKKSILRIIQWVPPNLNGIRILICTLIRRVGRTVRGRHHISVLLGFRDVKPRGCKGRSSHSENKGVTSIPKRELLS